MRTLSRRCSPGSVQSAPSSPVFMVLAASGILAVTFMHELRCCAFRTSSFSSPHIYRARPPICPIYYFSHLHLCRHFEEQHLRPSTIAESTTHSAIASTQFQTIPVIPVPLLHTVTMAVARGEF